MRVVLSLSEQQLAAIALMSGAGALDRIVARAVAAELHVARPPRWRGRRPRGRRPTPAPRGAGALDAVVAPGSGCAVALAAGARLRIEQIAGGQAVDLCAFARRDPVLAFSAARTRSLHGLHPTAGAVLWSGAPETALAEIAADTAPGHDLCFPACTAFEYEPLSGRGDHASCAAIAAATLARAGLPAAPHDPLNLWLPSEVAGGGTLRSYPAACRRGDHVDLLARTDVILLANPCPDDLYGSSQYEPRAVRVLAPAGGAELLALLPPLDLGARTRRTVLLPERLRAPLERLRADGWLGDRLGEVARALLFRWWERERAGQAPAPGAAGTSHVAV